MNPLTFRERMEGYFEPAILLVTGAYHFVAVTTETTFRRGQPFALLLNISQIRDEAFSRFWINFSSPRDAANSSPDPDPQGSSALIPPLLATVTGTVLDIGPGSGTQVPLMAKHADQVTRIYGAEPCIGLHDTLSSKLSACGLTNKYTILPCSADPTSLYPGLEKAGLLTDSNGSRSGGIFDTIICIRVLCSVPDPQRTTQGLYDLLRPGGKMIVCEHVVNPWTSAKGSPFARLMQLLYQLCGWSFFIGNCNLQRDTKKVLMQVATKDGGWERADLEGNFEWSTLPYLSGVLVKRA